MDKPTNAKPNLRSSKKGSTVTKKAVSKIEKPKAVSETSEKRKRKPNLRYVDDANGLLDSKKAACREVAAACKTTLVDGIEAVTAVSKATTETVTSRENIATSSATPATEAVSEATTQNANEKPIKKRRKSKKVRYEVNCGDIKDLDILEFQTYLKSEVKVAGKKNSPYLQVSKQGQKIIIKSKMFVAKKSVRFSARKYFKDKKNRLVSVVNESRNSYKLSVKM